MSLLALDDEDMLVKLEFLDDPARTEEAGLLPLPRMMYPDEEDPHGSIFTEHGSLFTEHGSLFTEHGSIFTQHGSIFTQHGSIFTEHGSIFTEHGSIFT